MNKSELKTNHSALFDEVRNEGVNAERERQGSWMAWFSVDNDAVMKGIESGKEISPSQREAFIAKQSKATRLGEMKSEAAGDLTPADSKSAQEIVDAQQKEEEEFYKDI